ncbi:MAG: PDZ domain-containing protein [Candidatus Marinimicrobia bacterium]|nr:PDZ domain-containing protein [Candidatus Neomarinimicrobiota bacterium]
MTNKTDHLAAWSNLSGTLIAIASHGALAIMMTLAVSLLIANPAYAEGGSQIKIDISQDLEQELGDVAMEVQEALDEIGVETGINIHINDDDNDSRPKLGVYLSDMDFEDAYKMRYPYAHGVLVNGTVNNGAADKAGIIEDDIIMFFDGSKVRYEDHLVRLIRSKDFGDKVSIVFWRDESIDSTVVTFVAPVKKDKDTQLKMAGEDKKEKKRKNSRGYGGGGFTPMLVQDEFVDVEELLNELGLNSLPFSSDGMMMWGGSGQGYVGNGWFLGGFGNFGSAGNTVDVYHTSDVANADPIERKINMSMGYGGLTIEKRLAPFSFMTIGGGVGLGLGGIDVNVTQDEGNFDWGNTLSDQLIDTRSTSVNFSKNYAIVHPRANVMIKLTGWMRLKAEYGYLYGYGFTDGWKTTLGDAAMDTEIESYELDGSQGKQSEISAPTMSLGLWFGF